VPAARLPIVVRDLFYREAGPGYHVAEHDQPLHQWYVCIHGTVATRLAGTELVLGPGQSVLYRPGVRREPRCRGRAPGYLVAVFADRGLDLGPVCDRPLTMPLGLRGDLQALIAELQRPQGAESTHLANALLVRLLIGQRRAALAGRLEQLPLNARAAEGIVGKAEAFMRANLHRHLTRAQVARAAGCSEPHLARLLRSAAGATVIDRLTVLRLERARALLRESGASVGAVAAQVGFASASHFAALFRQAAGMSPSDYRRAGGAAWV
jgi:AraC-like DNA-binding protein